MNTDEPLHLHTSKAEGDFDTLLLLVPSIIFIIIIAFYLFSAGKNIVMQSPNLANPESFQNN
ncbi:hypothetical protein A2115_00090 [Candidatus Woesebacteria bacterium GWA1_41_8]|jgi:hypothetical protein|uniref:Uncharacterized protein n=1 Tax=Candidatus Woesebacteria bacterium GWA1_41_8 TaxID=1802471 RepID=A0A1F7WJ69_9BACT|nr:MAG: hypothetical protein A2115_00090 [Candidatus Woesebacteria bacterium GWA1_41_8]